MIDTLSRPDAPPGVINQVLSPRLVFALDAVMHSGPDAARLAAIIGATPARSAAAAFGRVTLAPLIIGFCGWLRQRAQDDGIRELHFLSREGRVFKDVFDILYPPGSTEITTRYLFASRRLVQLAEINAARDVADLAEGAVCDSTVAQWLDTRFGLDQACLDPAMLRRHGFRAGTDPVMGSGAHGRISALAFDMAPMIIARAQKNRATLLRYLDACGLRAGPVGLVDIGYSGTVQRSYARLTDQAHRGYYLATSPRADPVRMHGYLGAQVPLHSRHHGICHNRHVYETLLCAPEDSVGGLIKTATGWAPTPAPLADCPSRREFVREAHGAVCALARDFARPGTHHRTGIRIAPDIAARLLDCCLNHPSRNQAALLADLCFDDLRAGGARIPLIGNATTPPIWREGARALGRDTRAARPWAGDTGIWTRFAGTLASPLIRRLGSARDLDQFRASPRRYVSALSNPGFRRLGQIIFRAD